MTRPEKGLSSNEFLLRRIHNESPFFSLSLFFGVGGGGYFSGLFFFTFVLFSIGLWGHLIRDVYTFAIRRIFVILV